MNDLREAAQQALEAIEQGCAFDYLDNTIAPALRAALAKPQDKVLIRDLFALSPLNPETQSD